MSACRSSHRLEELAAGRAGALQAWWMRRHLARCETCRRELEEIRAQKQALADLPREVRPPRDLWDGIARRIRLLETEPAPAGLFEAAPVGRRLVAALAVAVVALAGVLLLTRSPAGPPVEPILAEIPAPLKEFEASERQAREASEALRSDLMSCPTELAVRLAAPYERNLGTIDGAIAELRRALAADPGNSRLLHELRGSYLMKMELLRQIGRALERWETRTDAPMNDADTGRGSWNGRA